VSTASDKSFVVPFTVQQIQSILEKVQLQLVTKTSDGKFQATKSLLLQLTASGRLS